MASGSLITSRPAYFPSLEQKHGGQLITYEKYHFFRYLKHKKIPHMKPVVIVTFFLSFPAVVFAQALTPPTDDKVFVEEEVVEESEPLETIDLEKVYFLAAYFRTRQCLHTGRVIRYTPRAITQYLRNCGVSLLPLTRVRLASPGENHGLKYLYLLELTSHLDTRHLESTHLL
jgi:hypothetical protein